MMRHRRAAACYLALAASALVVAACTNSGGQGTGNSSLPQGRAAVPSVGAKVKGGTATFAEAPGAPPTYVFPMEPAIQETVANIETSLLLYRPLYWYGNNQDPSIDYSYSVANPPVFSDGGRKVTITLKPWKWSDGETVTSRDVEFWMNLLEATKASGSWGVYTQGYFPDMIVKQQYPNASTIVFTLNKSYDEKWFLYSELSQITPLPMAWDRTSLTQPAPSPQAANLPDTTPAGARAVYKLLNAQSLDISGWAASPLWSVVDGPWRLTSSSSTGRLAFRPNPAYSGYPKATLSAFIEEPFTTDQAEFNAVQSQGPGQLQFGYISPEYAPESSKVERAGYSDLAQYDFSYSFLLINFNNPTLGPVFRQLYVRQALQHTVDQQGWIHAFLHGDAVPTYGPLPIEPKNSYTDAYEQSDPYPFDLTAARRLLTAHGWTDRNGVDVCTRPGDGSSQCGAGVKPGQSFEFTLAFASGMTSLAQEMQNLQADAKQVGIKIDLVEHPANILLGLVAPCTPSQGSCSWEAVDYGSGVQYAIGYYPSGEQLLATGAGFNLGNYSDPTMDRLINATTSVPLGQAQSTLNAYENYAAQQLPYIYTPTSAGNPYADNNTLVSRHLGGVTFNVFTLLTPETWYLTK